MAPLCFVLFQLLSGEVESVHVMPGQRYYDKCGTQRTLCFRLNCFQLLESTNMKDSEVLLIPGWEIFFSFHSSVQADMLKQS